MKLAPWKGVSTASMSRNFTELLTLTFKDGENSFAKIWRHMYNIRGSFKQLKHKFAG
jgi:hypothetical protein